MSVEQCFYYCKSQFKLYPSEFDPQKKRSTINTIVMLVYIIQVEWEGKKLAAALFIDVKRVLDHFSKC